MIRCSAHQIFNPPQPIILLKLGVELLTDDIDCSDQLEASFHDFRVGVGTVVSAIVFQMTTALVKLVSSCTSILFLTRHTMMSTVKLLDE